MGVGRFLVTGARPDGAVDWRFLAIAALLFLALRAPVLAIPLTPSSDAAWYLNRALDIVAGRGYSENGLPTAYWPVGYPGFLAALFAGLGSGPFVVKIANLVLGGATLGLIYSLCRSIFGHTGAARLAVLMYAIYPNQIAYTAVALTEILFTFLFTLSLWLFVSRPRLLGALGSGAVMGMASLVKPQAIIFPALLLAGFAWMRRRELSLSRLASLGLATYAACILVIAPWTIRNYVTLGAFVLVSTNGGLTLYGGNNPNATGGYVLDENLPPEFRPRVADQVAIDRNARRAAVEWIEAHPGQALALIPAKIWRLWAPDGEGDWAFESGYAGYGEHVSLFRFLRALNQVYYAVVMILFGCALAVLIRRIAAAPDWSWLGVAVVLYTTLIAVAFSGQSRFHFPAMPWLMMYVSWFLVVKLGLKLPAEWRHKTAPPVPNA